MLILNSNTRKNRDGSERQVNSIQKTYVNEGIYSKNFYNQLIKFIGYILDRYSPGGVFPDDMVSFAYLRVMERLGAVKPEKPKLIDPACTPEDELKNKKALEAWNHMGRECLFDASRSNLGNYIFAIVRHAHSNYMYHNSKKFKELEPPATELPEPEISYNPVSEHKPRVLEYINQDLPELPLSLRRYLIWLQSN